MLFSSIQCRERKWVFSFHHFLVSFSSRQSQRKSDTPCRVRRVPALNTLPCDGQCHVFPSVLSNPLLLLLSYNPLCYSWQVPDQGQLSTMGGASCWVPGNPKQAAARCAVWPQTEHSSPCGVKTDPLASFGCLIHRGRVTPWLGLSTVAGEDLCCSKWRQFPETLVSFGFAPFLVCSVLIIAEETAMFHPHMKSHLFTASGDLFLYLRFHWVWISGHWVHLWPLYPGITDDHWW